MMKVRVITVALMAAFCSVASPVALAQTASDWFVDLPGLPDTVPTDACASSESLRPQIEQSALQASFLLQNARPDSSMGAVSDEQGAYVELLLDPQLQACTLDAETAGRWLVEQTNAGLQQGLDVLEMHTEQALATCGSEQSDGYEACYSGAMRAHELAARELAQRSLDVLRPAYDEWRDGVTECLFRREQVLAHETAGSLSGPFAALVPTMAMGNWTMLMQGLETTQALCVALDAAARLAQH